jgi:transcriptional regulator with XRE-family HTH domain
MNMDARIRRLRKQKGRALQNVSDCCGFTRSLLSKIETGKTTPPISALMKIADALGTNLPALLDGAGLRATAFTQAPDLDATTLTWTGKGYAFFAFAAERGDKGMQPILFVAEKGKVKPKALSHNGEEFVYVLERRMKCLVGTVEYRLGPGESLYFNAVDEHYLEPLSARVVFLGIFQTIENAHVTEKEEA